MNVRLVVLTLLAVILTAAAVCTLSAQTVPQVINYQGKLSDSSGKPLPDGSYSVEFKIYRDEKDGEPVWVSPPLVVNTFGGVFNTLIGSIPDNVFDLETAYLETVIEKTPLSPRQRLVSVAYAFRANKAYDIADGIVTSPKIAADAVSDKHVSAAAQISPSKIAGTAWTSTNDGSASGLDADKLDGLEATNFAVSAHNHDTTYIKQGQTGTAELSANLLFNGLRSVIAPSGLIIDGPGNLDVVVGASDITIKGDAANTFIKILADGTVQIKSAGNMNIAAGGALSLSGTAVNINSTMNGQFFAGGTLDFRGSLIKLN